MAPRMGLCVAGVLAGALGAACSKSPPSGSTHPAGSTAPIVPSAAAASASSESVPPGASAAGSMTGGAAALAWGENFQVTTGLSRVPALAVDGGYVYWFNEVHGRATDQTQTLRRVPSAGGAVQVLARGVKARRIEASGGTVFWVDLTAGRLMALDGTGPAPRILLEEPSLQPEIAVDSGGVYVTTSTALLRVPRGGGAAVTLVRGNSVHGVAVDGDVAYFADGSALEKVPTRGGATAVLASLPPDTVGLDVALDGPRVVTMTQRKGDYDQLMVVQKSGGDPLPVGDSRLHTFPWAPAPGAGGEILLASGSGVESLASPDDTAFAPDSDVRKHNGLGLPTRVIDVAWGDAMTIVADDRYAYYAGDHVLRRVPLDRTLSTQTKGCPTGQFPVVGGPTQAKPDEVDRLDRLGVERAGGTILLADVGAGRPLATYGHEVFVSNGDRVRAVQVESRAVRDVVSNVKVEDLAVDAGKLFWTDPDDDQVESVPTQGGTAVVVAADRPSPQAIAAGGGRVGWVEQPKSAEAPGRLAMASEGGGPVEVVDASVDQGAEVANDGSYLYWTGHGPFMMRRRLSGGAIEPVGCNAKGLVAQAGRVAWGDRDERLLFSIGPDGAFGFSMLYAFGPMGHIGVDRNTVVTTRFGAGKPGIVFAPPNGTCATAGPWLPTVFTSDAGKIVFIDRYIVAQVAGQLVRFSRR